MTLTQKLRTNRDALVDARKNHTTASETVAALIDAIGYENAAEIIAAMVNAKGEWDGRISRTNRAWAAEQNAPDRETLDDMCVWYCDEIHPAHMDEIATAMRNAEKPAEPQEEPTPEAEKEEPETMKTPYKKAIERNPESKTAWRLPGYTGPVFTIEYGLHGHEDTHTAHFCTEREYREHVEYCKRYGYKIHSTTKTENGIKETIPAETAQEKTDRENREHCKHIAEELEEYASGNVYRCPECGSICTIEEGEDADGFTVYRTSCGCTLEYEPEQLSVYDFIADAYDIEYRAGSDKEYRSAKIMVACGGPNIYIDTASRSVKLYWWTDCAEYPISSDACDELDNIMEDLWRC